ncbi:hypothetical protein LSAT2_003646 [Lamellibrachia satsuma]|nr:hypothetical protein LSAT2_003646 [Lamellibrachia satsuma]
MEVKVSIECHLKTQPGTKETRDKLEGKETPPVTVDSGATSNIVDSGATSNIVDSGATSNIVDSAATSNIVDSGATSNIVDSGATSNIVDSGATSNIVDSGATSNIVDSGATGNVVDSGATSNIVDSGATSNIVDSGATSCIVDSGATSNIVDEGTWETPKKQKRCLRESESLRQITLHINTEIKPVAQPLRRIPFNLRNKVDEKIKELVERDIIEGVDGPTPWLNAVVIVPTSNSSDIRLCIDMRRADEAIVLGRYPTPTFSGGIPYRRSREAPRGGAVSESTRYGLPGTEWKLCKAEESSSPGSRRSGLLHEQFHAIADKTTTISTINIELILRLVSDGKLTRQQKKTFRNLQEKVAMQWDLYRSGDKTAMQCPKTFARLPRSLTIQAEITAAQAEFSAGHLFLANITTSNRLRSLAIQAEFTAAQAEVNGQVQRNRPRSRKAEITVKR